MDGGIVPISYGEAMRKENLGLTVARLKSRAKRLEERLHEAEQASDSNANILRYAAAAVNLCCEKLGVTNDEIANYLRAELEKAAQRIPSVEGRTTSATDPTGERSKILPATSDGISESESPKFEDKGRRSTPEASDHPAGNGSPEDSGIQAPEGQGS